MEEKKPVKKPVYFGIKKVTKYETRDGKLFDTLGEAEAHEKYLKKQARIKKLMEMIDQTYDPDSEHRRYFLDAMVQVIEDKDYVIEVLNRPLDRLEEISYDDYLDQTREDGD